MPRSVRAYWIDAKVDSRGGRRSVSFGPPGREGDADITFYIRGPQGEVLEAFSVLCRTHGPKDRHITIQNAKGEELVTVSSHEGEIPALRSTADRTVDLT